MYFQTFSQDSEHQTHRRCGILQPYYKMKQKLGSYKSCEESLIVYSAKNTRIYVEYHEGNISFPLQVSSDKKTFHVL